MLMLVEPYCKVILTSQKQSIAKTYLLNIWIYLFNTLNIPNYTKTKKYI